jgi:hypothetical protein
MGDYGNRPRCRQLSTHLPLSHLILAVSIEGVRPPRTPRALLFHPCGRAEEQPIRRHTALKAWFDLGRYARVVLAAQDSCRFVLGFTLCESFMRVWRFGRL